MDGFIFSKPVFPTGPFQDSGECSDEVVFNFSNGKKLYVSQNFLLYASPVFKEMFQEEFKETESKEILMKQEYSDFLELLLSLHPGVQKPIDKSNVLIVVSLAEEYQIKPLIRRCQNVMIKWLTMEVNTTVNASSDTDKAKHARRCLTILIRAKSLGYEDVVTHAVKVLARFPYEVFTGSGKVSTCVQKSVFGFGISKVHENKEGCEMTGEIKKEVDCSFGSISSNWKTECPVEECKKLFENLSEETKIRLLFQRLKSCDDGKMR